MCFIHVLHTCASCALYAHGRIVGLLLFFFLLYFSVSSAQQSLTARQNEPSIEGPEGPRPTAMIVVTQFQDTVPFTLRRLVDATVPSDGHRYYRTL